jgi:5'-3' exonuclease
MENKRIACVDADSIVYQCAANKIKYNELGQPIIDDLGNKVKEDKTLEDCKKSVDEFITNLLDVTAATHYILALTVGRCHRYEIYPEYKANRKDREKPKHFDAIKEYLITKYKAIWSTDLEADDIVLIYSKRFTNESAYAFICSLDQDLTNLEGTHYNYSKNTWVQVSKEEANKSFWFDMIKGQAGDNVKGIPGKGEKFAEDALTEAFNTGFTYSQQVLLNYIDKFGEDLGIKEFYKNYQVLKIKDSWPNFKVEEPIEYKRPEPLDINLIDY